MLPTGHVIEPCLAAPRPELGAGRLLFWTKPGRELLSRNSGVKLTEHPSGRSVVKDRKNRSTSGSAPLAAFGESRDETNTLPDAVFSVVLIIWAGQTCSRRNSRQP